MGTRWERVIARDGGRGPGRRWGHTCNAVEGGRFLYVFGGYGESNCQTNDVHVFDTVNLTWSKPATSGIPPYPRDSHTTTTVGNKLFVFGGTDGSNPLNDLHILDTSSNTWVSPTTFGKGPDAREGHAAALVGRRLFIFGGCGKSPEDFACIYYDDLYSLDTESLVWKRFIATGIPPCARESHTCSSWRNKLIILGGEDASDYYLSDVHMLDTDAHVWSKMATFGQMLAPRAGHSTLSLGTNLFVYGGFADDRNLYNDLHILNADSGVWSRVANADGGPSPRFSAAGDCIDPQKGIFVVYGGCNVSLEALGDMYYLHAGFAADVTFQAMVTSASPHAYTLETRIDGKLLRGILFSEQPSSPPGLRQLRRNAKNNLLNDGLPSSSANINQHLTIDSAHGLADNIPGNHSTFKPEKETSSSNVQTNHLSAPKVSKNLERNEDGQLDAQQCSNQMDIPTSHQE